MKTIILLLASGMLMNGCYSNRFLAGKRDAVRYLSSLNDAVDDKTARIELGNGEIFTGKSIIVRRDSTIWRDAETGLPKNIETSRIRVISIRKGNAIRGLGQGFLLGAGMGALLIVGVGIDDCSGEDQICIERGPQQIVDGALLLGLPFGLIGLISGAATKTSVRYQFE